LRSQGFSQRETAQRLGISARSIYRIERRAQITDNQSAINLHPAAYQRYQQLQACIRVATELGVYNTGSHERVPHQPRQTPQAPNTAMKKTEKLILDLELHAQRKALMAVYKALVSNGAFSPELCIVICDALNAMFSQIERGEKIEP
jgi:transcriptional regulator with XRE-family HTH domain